MKERERSGSLQKALFDKLRLRIDHMIFLFTGHYSPELFL